MIAFNFFLIVIVKNETVASVGQLQAVADSTHIHKDVFQVEVLCRQIGDTEVVYRVGNIASTSNVFPVQASIQITVRPYWILISYVLFTDSFIPNI